MSALMKRTLFYALVSTALITATAPLLADEVEPGFTPLCDGKTFDGWKPSEVNKDTWKIEDGAFVTRGKTCHLFYVGDLQPFKNFDLKVDVMTEPHANGGIYFHTKYQPKAGRGAGSSARSIKPMATGSRPAACGASSTSASVPPRITSGIPRRSSSRATPLPS